MEILGIGPSELVFIILLALIILGPKDMQKAGKTIGRWMRSIVTSDGWRVFQQTSRELRTLPNRLMREANDELNRINSDLNKPAGAGISRPAERPNPVPRSQPLESPPNPHPDNKIAPPRTESRGDEVDQGGDA